MSRKPSREISENPFQAETDGMTIRTALDLASQWLVDWKQSKKTGRRNDRT